MDDRNNHVIEWAPFRLAEGADEAALLMASQALQAEFLSQQKGFIGRELVRDTDGRWVDLVRWDSLEHAEQAAQNAPASPAALQYFSLMVNAEKQDPSMDMLHLAIVRSYP